MLRPGQSVPSDITESDVLDARGARVRVGSLWERGPCLLVLLRHFGCVGCAEQVRELASRLFDLARAGVRTVLVGNGSVEQRAGFVERHALEGAPVEVFTDPSLGLYQSLDLVRSVWATVGPRALVEMARALAAGQPHRPIAGDPLQQGGLLLVDGRGVVRLHRRSRSIADHPPASDLVFEALKLAIETRHPDAQV